MPELTQKKLKEILKYNPEKGVFTWKIDKGRAKAGQEAGNYNPNRYIEIKIDGKIYKSHRLAWFYIYGEWPKYIDHINHVESDNRIENLRNVSHQKNGCNRSLNKNNTSGVSGVCWYKATSKWKSQIKVSGKKIGLGYFKDKFDAICAIKSAQNKYGFHENHGQERQEL